MLARTESMLGTRGAMRSSLAGLISIGPMLLGTLALVWLLLLRWAASQSATSLQHKAQQWPMAQWRRLQVREKLLQNHMNVFARDEEASLGSPGPPQTPELGLLQEMSEAKFAVHILDANDLLEEIPELRDKKEARCNLLSREVWPHTQHGRGLDASKATEHWAYQHSTQWWFKQALQNSSLVKLVNSTEEADMIYVDLHCFTLWLISYDHPFGNKNQPRPAVYLDQIVSHIERSERFQRKQGADYIFMQSHPAMLGGTVAFSWEKMCGVLRNVYWMLPERDMLCRGDQVGPLLLSTRINSEWEALLQNRAVLVPYLTVTDLQLRPISQADRPIFLFYRGSCASATVAKRRRYSSGKLMRLALVNGIRGLPPEKTGLGERTRVTCSCDICSYALDHKETAKRLASSLFCPVMPGDTQSSRRVSEVILSGCIPVFIGPPYHTMPMADVVDYRAFSVFLRFQNTSEWILAEKRDGDGWNGPSVLEAWQPDTNLTGAEHSVHSMEEAFWYLHSIPEAEIDRMQAALSRERYKLLYSPPPGAKTSQLGELLVHKLSQRAKALWEAGGISGVDSTAGTAPGRQGWDGNHAQNQS